MKCYFKARNVRRGSVAYESAALRRGRACGRERGQLSVEADTRVLVQRLSPSNEGTRVWLASAQAGRQPEHEMFGELPQNDWLRLHELPDGITTSPYHWMERPQRSFSSRFQASGLSCSSNPAIVGIDSASRVSSSRR